MSESFIKEYLKSSSKLIGSLASFESEISLFANKLAKVIVNNKKIMFCGNGGSAADAQHLTAELVVRLRDDFKRKALPSISLSLDSSTLTACSNDIGFDNIFSRALDAIGQEGDALFALSTSGNSPNILNAIKRAKEKGIKVFSLIGKDGGSQKSISDFTIIVPSQKTSYIQESHICIGHIIMYLIEEELREVSFL